MGRDNKVTEPIVEENFDNKPFSNFSYDFETQQDDANPVVNNVFNIDDENEVNMESNDFNFNQSPETVTANIESFEKNTEMKPFEEDVNKETFNINENDNFETKPIEMNLENFKENENIMTIPAFDNNSVESTNSSIDFEELNNAITLIDSLTSKLNINYDKLHETIKLFNSCAKKLDTNSNELFETILKLGSEETFIKLIETLKED